MYVIFARESDKNNMTIYACHINCNLSRHPASNLCFAMLYYEYIPL